MNVHKIFNVQYVVDDIRSMLLEFLDSKAALSPKYSVLGEEKKTSV